MSVLSIKNIIFHKKNKNTNRFIKHAGLPVFVFPGGTVYKAVAEDVVVYAVVATLSIGGWACKSLHAIGGGGTFCKTKNKYILGCIL